MNEATMLAPGQGVELRREVTGVLTANWETVFDGRRYAVKVALKASRQDDAKTEVGELWGDWSWRGRFGSRLATPPQAEC